MLEAVPARGRGSVTPRQSGDHWPPSPPQDPRPRLEPLPWGGALEADVWWVDRFGNCQLNVGPEELAALGAEPGATLEVRCAGRAKAARWVHTFADARPSELVLLVDSYGLLALALDRRSAAAEYDLRPGSTVVLVPPGATVPA